MRLSGQTHICSAGETWDSVALKIYGEEGFASDLLNANPALCAIPIFSGGEVLKLPVVEVNGDEDDEAFMPAVAPWKE